MVFFFFWNKSLSVSINLIVTTSSPIYIYIEEVRQSDFILYKIIPVVTGLALLKKKTLYVEIKLSFTSIRFLSLTKKKELHQEVPFRRRKSIDFTS